MTARPQILRTQAEEELIRQFEARFADGRDPLAALRADAFSGLREAGLPHRRVEEYKYTDLKSALRAIPEIAERPPLEDARKALAAADAWGDIERHRIVFADGYYFAELSSSGVAGLAVTGVADALAAGEDLSARIALIRPEKTDPSLDLNTAFMVDGVLVHLGSDFDPEVPLELVFLTVAEQPASQYVRSAVTADPGTRATVLETHAGRSGVAGQSNVVFEATVPDDAEITWIKLQNSGDAAIHLATTLSRLGRAARFDHFIFTLGSKLSRTQSFLTFAGEGSEANLRGVTMLRGREHADVTLLVDHAVPQCVSRERFKAVVDGKAKGVFQGRIIVRPGAQQTDGRMMTQALLLSDDAQIANKPELEIFADDVQCAHGATTGQIDEDLLFYLMARGIPEEQARTLLVLAFLGETIEEIGNERLTDRLEEISRGWLMGQGATP